MKKLYWTIKIISALVGLVFLANIAVPNWRDALIQGAGKAVNWGQQEANNLNHQMQPGTPQATPASPRQAPPALRLVLVTPGAGNTAPAPEQGPPPATAVATPSAGVVAWSSDQCRTMVADMSWDAQLDATTATQQSSTNPAQSAYYATWSAHWQTVAEDLAAGPCAIQPVPLSGTQCSDPEQWFQTAIDGHVADEQANPQNKSWDDQWIAIYQTAIALWPTAGCS